MYIPKVGVWVWVDGRRLWGVKGWGEGSSQHRLFCHADKVCKGTAVCDHLCARGQTPNLYLRDAFPRYEVGYQQKSFLCIQGQLSELVPSLQLTVANWNVSKQSVYSPSAAPSCDPCEWNRHHHTMSASRHGMGELTLSWPCGSRCRLGLTLPVFRFLLLTLVSITDPSLPSLAVLSVMTVITLSLIQESTQLSLSWAFFLYWIKCPQCSLLTLPFCNRFNVSTPVFLLLVSSLMRKPTNLRAAYAIACVF